ncbi:MAG: LytTR family DNA-binding domain-containing protein [Lachnospiraceae bacterium]|nr:LytTR family DNA-binding domain-containing protein [Lachnospiraceae bacterium]
MKNGIQALDFVIKPVNYYSFSMKMQSAFHIIEQKKSRNIVISTPGGIRKISTDDLLYAEVDRHYLFYHTNEGVFRQKVSLKELEDKLAGLSFKRCNNCYLINLKHVECVDKDDVKVGDDWLKISRPRKKEFLQALANYMGGTGI